MHLRMKVGEVRFRSRAARKVQIPGGVFPMSQQAAEKYLGTQGRLHEGVDLPPFLGKAAS